MTVYSSLLAAAVVKASEIAYPRIRSFLSEPERYENLPPLETAFFNPFREKLYERADSKGNPELLHLAEWWDYYAGELDGFSNLTDEEEAVERLVEEVYAHPESNLSRDSHEEVRKTIAEGYRHALSELHDRVAEDPELVAQLNKELQIETIEQLDTSVDNLSSLIERAIPSSRYKLFNSDEVDKAINEILDEKDLPELVDRPEIKSTPNDEWLLVTGPTGSGKSRVIEGLVRQRTDWVEHILVPTSGMKSQDQWAFEHLSFSGDVLLVWDEIGKRGVVDDFRDIVSIMEEHVEEQGYKLHVLAAIRSGRIGNIPDETIRGADDIHRSSLPIWQSFKPLKLKPFPDKKLRILIRNIAEVREVELDSDVQDALSSHVEHKSAPAYIDAVFRTSESLTETDINEMPNSAIDIWREAFNGIDDSGDAIKLLRACRLLYDIEYPYKSSVVYGVYKHVLNGNGKDEFLSAINFLIDGSDWLSTNTEGKFGQNVVYRLHDTQVEAIERNIATFISDFSVFLNREASNYASEDFDLVELHNKFANTLQRLNRKNLARNHYKRALELTSPTDNPLNSSFAKAHNKYAQLLQEEGQTEMARKHYKRALEITSPTENTLDSDYAEAHYNFASLLYDDGEEELVREHVNKSIDIWQEYYQELSTDIDKLATTILNRNQITVDGLESANRSENNRSESQTGRNLSENVESLNVSQETLETIALAIRNRKVQKGILTTCVGKVQNRDAVAQTADFLINVDGVTVAFVYGFIAKTDDSFVDSVLCSARSRNSYLHLGQIVQDAFAQIGEVGVFADIAETSTDEDTNPEFTANQADMAGGEVPLGLLGDVSEGELESLIDVVSEVMEERLYEIIEDYITTPELEKAISQASTREEKEELSKLLEEYNPMEE